MITNSPCVIPSPPTSRAFSLVRKVQGRLPAAGEASMGLQRMGKSSPVPQPASGPKQKCPFHIPEGKSYCLIGDCMFDLDSNCPIFVKHLKIVARAKAHKNGHHEVK